MTRFLVLGGAHIDRRATLSSQTHLGASNPGSWQEEPGGAGFNAAQTLARLGNTVSMVSPRGGDEAGETVARAAAALGITDMAQVFLDRKTASYSAVLDRDGSLVIGIADMELYDHFTMRQLSRKSIREAIDAADRLLCDANLPEATLTALAAHAAETAKPLAAIAISPAKIDRLGGALASIMPLFLNAAEAAAISRTDASAAWPERLRAAGVTSAVITCGPDPVIAFDRHGVFTISPPSAERIIDVTGAGDALCAATLDALGRDHPLPQAVRAGMAAALITIRSARAAPPEISRETLMAALPFVPQPESMP